jgi:hypothetical protein
VKPGDLAFDIGLGAIAGRLAGSLTPKVPGRFPNPFASRPLDNYGPKSWQALKGSGLGGYFGDLLSALKSMAGRK